MFSLKYPIIWFFILSVVSCFSLAQDNLYKESVSVSDRSQTARQEAVQQAFERVLTKLTMSEKIAQMVAENSDLKADQLVEQYSYHKSTNAPEESLALDVAFDARSVQQRLLANEIAVVGRDRPLLMVLENVKVGGDANIVSDQWGEEFQQEILWEAERFGVPVMFPSMDLSDLSLLSPQALWSSDINSAWPLVRRYEPHALLLGKVTALASNEIFSDWTLSFGEASYHWTFSSANYQEMTKQLFEQVADTYRQLFAITDKSERQLLMRVVNVSDIREFASITHYLQEQDAVSGIEVKEVSANQIVLVVKVLGSLQVLIDALDIDNKLEQLDSDFAADMPVLVYTWRSSNDK